VAAGNNAFSPIWAGSGDSEAIGLSYGPIGIVRWLSSGGGKEEDSQNISSTEAILGVGGLLFTFCFATFWGNIGSAAKLDNVTTGGMPTYMLFLRGGMRGHQEGEGGSYKCADSLCNWGRGVYNKKMM
jgi:hypothetical protein